MFGHNLIAHWLSVSPSVCCLDNLSVLCSIGKTKALNLSTQHRTKIICSAFSLFERLEKWKHVCSMAVNTYFHSTPWHFMKKECVLANFLKERSSSFYSPSLLSQPAPLHTHHQFSLCQVNWVLQESCRAVFPEGKTGPSIARWVTGWDGWMAGSLYLGCTQSLLHQHMHPRTHLCSTLHKYFL